MFKKFLPLATLSCLMLISTAFAQKEEVKLVGGKYKLGKCTVVVVPGSTNSQIIIGAIDGNSASTVGIDLKTQKINSVGECNDEFSNPSAYEVTATTKRDNHIVQYSGKCGEKWKSVQGAATVRLSEKTGKVTSLKIDFNQAKVGFRTSNQGRMEKTVSLHCY